MAELTATSRPAPKSQPPAGEHSFAAPDERPGRRRRAPIYALLAGGAVSLVGNQLTALAIPWYVLQTTGSAGKTGLVAAATLLPMVVSLLFGGALADRLGHRRTSVVSDLLSAGTVASVPLLAATVGLPFELLLLLVFFGALLDGPGGTARTALMPEAAAAAGMPLERANGAFQAVQSLAGLVGPLLAGALIALMGERNVLWLDAAGFLVSAAAVAAFVQDAPRAGGERGRYLDEVRDGWRSLLGDPLLRSMSGLAILVNFLYAPLFAVLLPVLANREYGSASALGIAMAALGGGTLVGALLYGAIGPRLPRRPVLIGSFALSAAPLLLLAWAPPLWVTALATGVCGFGLGPLNPLVMTAMQERVPVDFRARVFGAVFATSMVAAPLGVLLAAGLTELVGVRAVIGGTAVGLLLLTVPILLTRSLHELDGRVGADAASMPAV